MGPGVACECIESKDGPVIWEDHFYPEIIDPKPAKCCPTARRASWCSPLTKEAFPVIRYRTRDLTRLLPPTSRSFRRIGKITGRSDDMLIIRGVNVPDPDRGADPARPAPVRQLPDRRDPRRPPGQREGALRSPARAVRQIAGAVEEISKELQHRIKTIIGISTKIT
jgi:phenylacetate-CoA ligase